MNSTIASLITLAYENKQLRPFLLPIILAEIDPRLIKVGKSKAQKKKDKARKKELKEKIQREKERREAERERIQNATIEEVLGDFEFIAYLKRTQSENYWKDPNTELENNINSVISKARGGSDASGQEISQEWASSILTELYKRHKEEVSTETAYGSEDFKLQLEQLHEMLDDFSIDGTLDEVRKQARLTCNIISRRMSEGSYVERAGRISIMADNYLWGLERQAMPIKNLLMRLKDLQKKQRESGEGLLDDELLEQASSVLGQGAYAASDLGFEETLSHYQDKLSEELGKMLIKGIKEVGAESISEGLLKTAEVVMPFLTGGVVGAVASAFGLEHKLRKVKGNVVEAVGRVVDANRGTQGSGQHWEEKFLQATMTPASINDEYQGRVSEIKAEVGKAQSKEDLLASLNGVREVLDQYHTEAKADIDMAVERSVVYNRFNEARNRGGVGGDSLNPLNMAIAGLDNMAKGLSRIEGKGQDLVTSRVASEDNHAGISLLLIEKELEKAYMEQEIIEAFEEYIPKMFERSVDILKDRDKRTALFSIYEEKIKDGLKKDDEE